MIILKNKNNFYLFYIFEPKFLNLSLALFLRILSL